MKKVIIFSLASVLFCIFACTNNPQPTTIAPEKVDSLNTKEEGHLIDYDNIKVLEVTYVTDRAGVEMKQQPDDNSLVLGRYDYGDKLEVIEMDGDWLGIRERITREIQGHQDGKKVVRSAWEKIYVQKSKTGNLGQI